jgi:proteasome assembly chaperone (PAC2) family protein
MADSELRVEDTPELRRPVLVAAFRGWNDGAQAASLAAGYLARLWDAEQFADVDPEGFFDFQATRPHVSLVDGVTRQIDWPETAFYHAQPRRLDRDVVLLLGIEPNARWRTFTDLIVDHARKLGVELVVTLGALLADVPHTRPSPVTGSASTPELVRELNLSTSRYEGPTGIAGVFQDACVAAGIPAVTFWAAVPHYVSHPPSPKATVALLRRVEDVLDIEVPLADLPVQAEEWERAVSEMTDDDDDLAEYVQSLEQRGDAEVDLNETLGKIDGDALAAEFERYLRRRRPGFGI